MKLLLTADLHLSGNWFRWLLENGRDYDLVCVAGDHLDLFSQTPKIAQAREAQYFFRRLAKVTRVALSSGNHDAVGSIIPSARGPTYPWLVELDEIRDLVSDGQTAIIGELVVSTIPYYCDPQAKRVWLDRGRKIRQERKLKWLVLHHEPPVLRKSASGEEKEADTLLREYAPDYWLSGHIHDLPYELGGKWIHLVGETLVFTPGQVPNAPWPNHVELDLASGRLSWRTTRRCGELFAPVIEQHMVRYGMPPRDR